ncbi:MAG: anti-sigma F factor, partial [Clostridia bacterium]|nr:anti-sigma F factor [Clostridia bacterium]
RTCVSAFCLQLNPTLDEIGDIKTAVSEAVTNCVVHAYPNKVGEITMLLSKQDDKIHIVIKDNGVGIADIDKALTPFYTTKPDEERSGMGFTVMDSFMDTLSVRHNGAKGLIVEMSKRIENKQAV